MILAGASAIVTGAAVRIGREIARALAQEGVNVCLHYGSSEQAAREAAMEFAGKGVQTTTIQADLTDPVNASKTIVDHAVQTFGSVQILINSAAIFEPARLAETTEDLWDRHFQINLKAPFFLTQQFEKRLGADAQGNVVNIIDWRGTRPVPGHDAYTMTKAALAAQTRLLAQELGPRIRINGVAPGPILPSPQESQEQFQQRAERNPLNKTGNPRDISDAVLFLLRSSMITGEILHVSGGEHL